MYFSLSEPPPPLLTRLGKLQISKKSPSFCSTTLVTLKFKPELAISAIIAINTHLDYRYVMLSQCLPNNVREHHKKKLVEEIFMNNILLKILFKH